MDTKYAQHIGGNWHAKIKMPDELVSVFGKTELSENDLPFDPRARERLAHRIINHFLTQIDEAGERFGAKRNAPD